MSFQKQIAQSLVWRGLYFFTILVMNIFLSRYFEADNSGWIFYLSNNFSLILIVVGLTMENSVNYYGSQNSINHNVLAWFSVVWTILVAVIVFAGLWFYFGRIRDTTDITRIQYLFYGMCYIVGIQLTNFFTILFYANKNFFLPNFLMVLLNCIIIVVIPKQVGMRHTDSALYINLFFALILCTGLVLMVAFMITKKSWTHIALPNAVQTKLLLRYAVVALAANVIFFLVYRVDYWFVKHYCAADDLGNYIQVSKLGQMLLIIPTIISSVVFPNIAGGMLRPEMKDNILRIGRLLTLLFIIIFLVAAALGNWIFPQVFGYTFSRMYWPFLLLIPGIWALSNLFILSAYFGGINKVRINVQGAAVALLFILVGDVLFIPKYGIIAAALVSTCGYVVNFLYSFYFLKQEHSVSIAEYWRLSKADIKWVRTFVH
jgi:O-antigen/teichoic acid export membrane protein